MAIQTVCKNLLFAENARLEFKRNKTSKCIYMNCSVTIIRTLCSVFKCLEYNEPEAFNRIELTN